MDDLLSIRVTVADRLFPLRIKREDEESIRKAVKMINDRVLSYRELYPDKDAHDSLAMATLNFVIALNDYEDKYSVQPMVEAVKELNLSVGYNFTKNLNTNIMYVNVDADEANSETDYNKYLASVEYKF